MSNRSLSLKERGARLLAEKAAAAAPEPARRSSFLDPLNARVAERRAADVAAGVVRRSGPGLDVAKLMASLPVVTARAAGAPLGELRRDQEAMAEVLLTALGPCPEDGSRSEAALALGGILRRLGAHAGVVKPLIEAWMGDESHNVADHVRRALDAWNHPAENVSGIGALREALGQERADLVYSIAEASLGAKRRAAMAARSEAKATKAENDTSEGGSFTGGPSPLSTNAGLLGTVLSFSDPERPIEYICPALGLAPNDGKVTMIAGLFGGAKGPFADYLAVCFALGAEVFGVHEVRRSNALILDFESSRLTMKRCRRIARGLERKEGELDGALHVMAASAAAVMDPQWLDTLAAYIEAHQIGVVVLDSYTRALLAHGVDFDRPEFAELAAGLASLKCCVIIIAHANKASATKDEPTLLDVSGSAALPSQVQTGIILYYPNRQDKNVVRVKCDRALEAPFVTFDATWSGDKDEPLKLSAGAPPARGRPARAEAAAEDSLASNVNKIVDAAKRVAPGELTTRALRSDSGLNSRAWAPAIKAAVASGRVNARGDGKGHAVMYSLGNPEPPNPVVARFRQSVDNK